MFKNRFIAISLWGHLWVFQSPGGCPVVVPGGVWSAGRTPEAARKSAPWVWQRKRGCGEEKKTSAERRCESYCGSGESPDLI